MDGWVGVKKKGISKTNFHLTATKLTCFECCFLGNIVAARVQW